MRDREGEEILKGKNAQMRKGLLEFCIFLVIARGKVYSSDILETLSKADLIVVEGTLYPLLNRLKKLGFVKYAWQESESGPPRKYYTLTESGMGRLETLSEEWKQLQNSVENLKKKK